MFKRSFRKPCCALCSIIPLFPFPLTPHLSNLQLRSSLLFNVHFGLFFPWNVNIFNWIFEKHGTINKEYLHANYRIITPFSDGDTKVIQQITEKTVLQSWLIRPQAHFALKHLLSLFFHCENSRGFILCIVIFRQGSKTSHSI